MFSNGPISSNPISVSSSIIDGIIKTFTFTINKIKLFSSYINKVKEFSCYINKVKEFTLGLK